MLITALNLKIKELEKKLKGDYLVFCLSGASEDNFRKQVLPTYKGNRAGARKPLCYNLLKKHLQDNHSCVAIDTLEGDDVSRYLSY